MEEEQGLANSSETGLAEMLGGLFDLAVSGRRDHFILNPAEIPDKKSVPSIIIAYSATNAAISGGASLIPGPFGMVAVIPEIAAVTRNQLAMIYDIGMAYGKSKFLTNELLVGVFLTAMGAGGGSLLLMHSSKVLVRRASLQAFQQVIGLLAGRITQQALKSAISKWLPLVGAAAMAVWSNYLTYQIGKNAIEIFEKEIELSDEIVEEAPITLDSGADNVEPVIETLLPPAVSLDMPKVQALINLMKSDGDIRAEEIEYVQSIIGNADLTESERAEINNAINESGGFDVDYSAIANSPDDAVGLLVDMVTLAKRDGDIHVAEKTYIRQVGKLLGFSEGDIEQTMATIGEFSS